MNVETSTGRNNRPHPPIQVHCTLLCTVCSSVIMSVKSSQPTLHEHSLSHTQSLAWVQIFLNISVACICHVRELIPWQATCFRTIHLEQIEKMIRLPQGNPYSALCSIDPNPNATSQELRILLKGGHRHSDQLLEMLVRMCPVDVRFRG